MFENQKDLIQNISSSRERSVFYFFKGLETLNKNETEQAEKFFQQSLDEDKSNTAARLYLINSCIKSGDYLRAENLAKEPLEFTSTHRQLWLSVLLTIYIWRGKSTEEPLNIALEMGDISKSAVLTTALFFEKHGQFSELKNLLEGSITIFEGSPKKLLIERLLRILWREEKNIESSLKILEEHKSDFTSHPVGIYYYAEINAKKGDWAKLKELFLSLSERIESPEEKSVLLLAAGEICEFYLKDIKSASEFYLKSYEINLKNEESYYRCIDLFKDEPEVLKRVYSERLNLFKEDKDAVINLSNIYQKEGLIDQALKIIEEVSPEKNAELTEKFIELVEVKEDWKKEADFLNRVLTEDWVEDSEKEYFVIKLAKVYMEKLSDYESTEKVLKEHLEKNPASLRALSILRILYTNLRKWNELIDVLDAMFSITTDPKEIVSLLFLKGEVYEFRLMDVDSALKCYEELLQIAPGYLPVLDALRRLYRKKKMWKKLLWINETKRGIVTDEKEHMRLLRENLDITKDELKDEEKYLYYLNQILDYEPYDHHLNEELIQQYFKRGQQKEALKKIKFLCKEDFPEYLKKKYLAILISDFSDLLEEEEISDYVSLSLQYQRKGEELWKVLMINAVKRGKELEFAENILASDLKDEPSGVRQFLIAFAYFVFDKSGKYDRLRELISKFKEDLDEDFNPLRIAQAVKVDDEKEFEHFFEEIEFKSSLFKEIKGYFNLLKGKGNGLIEEMLSKDDDFYHILNFIRSETKDDENDKSALYLSQKGGEYSPILFSKGLIEGKERFIEENLSEDLFECSATFLDALNKNNRALYLKSLEILSKLEIKDPFVQIGYARILGEEGKYENCLDLLERIEDEEVKVQAMYMKTDILEKTGNFSGCVETLLNLYGLVRETERKREILKRKIKVEVQGLKNFEQAAETTKELLREFPEEVETVNYVKTSLLQSKKLAECSDFLVDAARLIPDRNIKISFFIEAGKILEEKTNQPERSVEVLKAALEEVKDSTEIAATLSELLEKLQRWEELNELLEKRLTIESPESHNEIYFYMGKIRELHLEDVDSAIAAYASSLEINPNYVPSLERIVSLLHQKEEMERAIPYAKILLQRADDAEDAEALAIAGEVLFKGREIELAKQLFDASLKKDAVNLRAMKGLMNYYTIKEEWENFFNTAKDFSSQIEKKEPEKASEIYFEMGKVSAEKLNKQRDAVNYLKRSTVLNKKWRDPQFYLANLITEELKDFKQGVIETKRAVEMDPADPGGWHLYAKCLYMNKIHDKHFIALDMLNYLEDINEGEKKLYEISVKKALFYPKNDIPWDGILNHIKFSKENEELKGFLASIDKIAWKIVEAAEDTNYQQKPVLEHDKSAIDLRKVEKILGFEKPVSLFTSDKELFKAMAITPFSIILPSKVIGEINARRLYFSAAAFTLKSSLSFLVFNSREVISKVLNSLGLYAGVELDETLKSDEVYDQKIVKKGISWKERFEIKGIMKEISNLRLENLENLKKETVKNMWRFAFTLSGVPSKALAVIDKFLKEEEIKKDLLKYIVSETYFSLRKQLNLNLGG